MESAAVGLGLPYERLLNMPFRVVGGGAPEGWQITNLSYVTPGYFEALRVPLRRGRAFDAGDRSDSGGVIVVNEAFVRTYFDDGGTIGHYMEIAGRERQLVGVVGDVQQRPGWGNFGPLAPMPLAYIPVSQTEGGFLALVHQWFSPAWVVRSAAPVEGLVNGIHRAVESVDPLLPLAEVRNMAEVRAASLAPQRFLATLVAVFAGAALLLAAIGIHGLIATSVTERTRELGIRMALGATRPQAMKVVALPGVVLTAVGVGLGGLLAIAVARLLSAFLWGVNAHDPATFVGVAGTLLLVAAVASVVPALRLNRLDPAQTLRQE
ncbi:MAG: FtsX-like permease family protein [Acidobacteriota bacterium]